MTEIITFCNQKGGVGKTTTAFNITRAYSLLKKNVLVIDLDEQANLTTALIKDNEEPYELSLAELLIANPQDDILTVLTDTIWDNVMLLPSPSYKAATLLNEMAGQNSVGSEFRLKKLLESAPAEFDVVIIDCGPAINKLTINALVASTKAVLVSQSQLYSAVALNSIAGATEAVKNSYNNTLKLAGIIVNQHKANTKSGRIFLEQIQKTAQELKSNMLLPAISDKQAIQRTISERRGIDELTGVSKADRKELLDAYKEIAKYLYK